MRVMFGVRRVASKSLTDVMLPAARRERAFARRVRATALRRRQHYAFEEHTVTLRHAATLCCRLLICRHATLIFHCHCYCAPIAAMPLLDAYADYAADIATPCRCHDAAAIAAYMAAADILCLFRYAMLILMMPAAAAAACRATLISLMPMMSMTLWPLLMLLMAFDYYTRYFAAGRRLRLMMSLFTPMMLAL